MLGFVILCYEHYAIFRRRRLWHRDANSTSCLLVVTKLKCLQIFSNINKWDKNSLLELRKCIPGRRKIRKKAYDRKQHWSFHFCLLSLVYPSCKEIREGYC
jgi:hypothetical protein